MQARFLKADATSVSINWNGQVFTLPFNTLQEESRQLAIKLREGDEVTSALLVDESDDVLLISRHGMSLRFTAPAAAPASAQVVGDCEPGRAQADLDNLSPLRPAPDQTGPIVKP